MAIALAIKIPSDEPAISRTTVAAANDRPERPVHLRGLPTMLSAEWPAAELDRAGTVVLCRKGQTLVEAGDPVGYIFKVLSGALRAVRLLADGRRHVASFHVAGDFVGLADGETCNHSIEALGDARLMRYNRASFDAMLDRDPGAGRRIFDIMRKQLAAAQDRLLLLGRKTAAERLASFLLTLADRAAAENGADSCEIELPMNRSDMADYLGLRIETICRLLTDLKHRRIIRLPGLHSVVVLRRDLLEGESESKA